MQNIFWIVFFEFRIYFSFFKAFFCIAKIFCFVHPYSSASSSIVTKYRYPVHAGGVNKAVYERIRYVAESREFNILELNGQTDHVYLLIEANPQKTSPGKFVNVIKTQTSRRARKLYGDTELKSYYWSDRNQSSYVVFIIFFNFFNVFFISQCIFCLEHL